MSLSPLRDRKAWIALEAHSQAMKGAGLRQLFAEDSTRGERLAVEGAGVYLDYSKNRINDETTRLLLQLANDCGLRERIDAMFRGDKINVSEKRAVLHIALRAPRGADIQVDGINVVAEVHQVLDRMAAFAGRLRGGEWKGHSGKRIRNVINIGIGGSDLGPVMAYEALKHYSDRTLTFRFVSNVDGTDFVEAVRDLDAEETLFIVSSKTFTTLETMIESCARRWSATGEPRMRAISTPNMKSTARTPRFTILSRANGFAAGGTFKRADTSSRTRSVSPSGELSAAAIFGSQNLFSPTMVRHHMW